MRRILVTGDRVWTDKKAVRQGLKQAHPDLVIHGGASGADTIAGDVALQMELPCLRWPARWSQQPVRAQGAIRNSVMLKYGKPTMVLAFHDHILKSKGTLDMMAKAVKAGIPTSLYCRGRWHTVTLAMIKGIKQRQKEKRGG